MTSWLLILWMLLSWQLLWVAVLVYFVARNTTKRMSDEIHDEYMDQVMSSYE